MESVNCICGKDTEFCFRLGGPGAGCSSKGGLEVFPKFPP